MSNNFFDSFQGEQEEMEINDPIYQSDEEESEVESSYQTKKQKLTSDSNNDSETHNKKKRIDEKRLKRKRQIAEKNSNLGQKTFSAAELKQQKKEEQMQKNRLSAQRSRDKAKEERTIMLNKISELEKEKNSLQSKLDLQVCKYCNQQLNSCQDSLNQHYNSTITNNLLHFSDINLQNQQQQVQVSSTLSDDSLSSQDDQRLSFDSFNYQQNDMQDYSSLDAIDSSYERARGNSLFSPSKSYKNFSFFMLVLYLLAISMDTSGSLVGNGGMRGTNQLINNPHQSFVQRYEDIIKQNYLQQQTQDQANVCMNGDLEILKCLHKDVGKPKRQPQDLLDEYENYYNESSSHSAVALPKKQSQQQPQLNNNNNNLRRNDLILSNDNDDIHLSGSKIYCPYTMKFDYEDQFDIVKGKPLKQLKILMDQQGLRQYRLAEDGSFQPTTLVGTEDENKMYELNCLVTEIKELPSNNCGFNNNHQI